MLLRYVILSLLRDEEMHGYRIKSAFEERLGKMWPLNFGQIYGVLNELNRRNLIVGRLESNGSHLGRRVYSATARGRRSLATWLARRPRVPVPARNEIFVRLLAAGSEDSTATLPQLENQEGVYRTYLAELADRRRELANGNGSTNRHRELAQLSIDATIYQVEAHLRWLRHCAKVLGNVAEPGPGAGDQRAPLPLTRKRQRRTCDVPATRSRSA